MQFLVIGYDGDDDGAPDRRQAARPKHLARGDELVAAGNLWYAAALTNDDGQMIGSMYMVDFPDQSAFDEWFKNEPYVRGDVWKTTTVQTCVTREPWQFNRPREFFDGR